MQYDSALMHLEFPLHAEHSQRFSHRPGLISLSCQEECFCRGHELWRNNHFHVRNHLVITVMLICQ